MTEDIQIVRVNLYNNASPAQRYLYSHPESGQKLSELAKKFSIPEQSYEAFVNVAGDVVLGLYQPQDMVPLLEQSLQVAPNVAQSIARDLLDFIAPLTNPNWQAPTSLSEETSLQSEIAATEAVIESLPQFRTMQTLASNNETVYTSTQAAILQEGAGLPVPPPTNTNEPRWDTAR